MNVTHKLAKEKKLFRFQELIESTVYKILGI